MAATRGGDNSLGMEGEADLATATREQALFWRNIYTEILSMEESVLERIRQLMADQSPQARQEVELTNVPVVVAQAERFRSRLGFWETACRRFDAPTECLRPGTPRLTRAETNRYYCNCYVRDEHSVHVGPKAEGFQCRASTKEPTHDRYADRQND